MKTFEFSKAFLAIRLTVDYGSKKDSYLFDFAIFNNGKNQVQLQKCGDRDECEIVYQAALKDYEFHQFKMAWDKYATNTNFSIVSSDIDLITPDEAVAKAEIHLKLPTYKEPGLLISGDTHIYFEHFNYKDSDMGFGKHPYVELWGDVNEGGEKRTGMLPIRLSGKTAQAFRDTYDVVIDKFGNHSSEDNCDNVKRFHYISEIHAPENQKKIVDGVAIDPVFPEHFNRLAIDYRTEEELNDWSGVAFVVSYQRGDYGVESLNGGAWDRPCMINANSEYTLEEAVAVAKELNDRHEEAVALAKELDDR